MHRRTAIQTLLGASAGFPAVLRGARRRAGEKPNLLFLFTDQQRADTMAAYGNTRFRVPAINRLASQSIVFDRCYVTQPICTPSRSSVMTGLWPHTNGCIDNNVPLREETPVLPELLGDRDYRTGYIGKWHLGDELFPQHGFQEWVTVEDGYNQHFLAGRDRSGVSSYSAFLAELGYRPDQGTRSFSREFAARLPLEHGKPAFQANRAADFILRHRAEPWMLYVAFLEPHRPYEGPLNDLHSEEEAPVPRNYPGLPVEREPRFYEDFRAESREKGYDLGSRAAIQRLNRNYAGLCSQMDQAVGRILWALESSGQAGNTIIVFTSDHGDMMGAHSMLAKFVMYEESVRVPLLVRVPFRQSGFQRVQRPVSHIGLAPMLLELMGRRPPESLEGESLSRILENQALRDDHVFLEWHKPAGRAVISPEGWKLALYEGDNCLLFDRRKDPLEMNNLFYRPESVGMIRKLRRRLEQWQKQTGDRLELSS